MIAPLSVHEPKELEDDEDDEESETDESIDVRFEHDVWFFGATKGMWSFILGNDVFIAHVIKVIHKHTGSMNNLFLLMYGNNWFCTVSGTVWKSEKYYFESMENMVRLQGMKGKYYLRFSLTDDLLVLDRRGRRVSIWSMNTIDGAEAWAFNKM